MFKVSKKIIIAGAIGNALEMYDIIIWGLFSVYLSKEFLPPQSTLPDIFFLFLITYILRPIGSLISGIFADHVGRKNFLIRSIFIMGISTSLIGILPSYGKIGALSVFLLLFIRLIQMLTVCGEYISSIALLIESCEKHRKGYYGSWAAFGVNAGTLIASLVCALVLYLIEANIIPSWGWRLVFIFSFITMVFGFWIRQSIPESFEFIMENARKDKKSFREIFNETFITLRSKFFEATLVFLLVWFGLAVTKLIFIYAPIHMTTINNLKSTQALMINSLNLILLIILIPFFGYLSDILGRVKMIRFGITLLSVLSIPYFICLTSGTFLQILFFHILIGIPCACLFAVIPVLITEIFPLSIRCSIISFIYSLASCLGGGLTPLLAFKLAKDADSGYAPGLLLVIFGCISLIILGVYAKKIRPAKKLTLVWNAEWQR